MNRKLSPFDKLLFRHHSLIVGGCQLFAVAALLAAVACCLFGRVGI